MNNSVFGKALETFRKDRDIKLVKQKRKKLFGVRTKVSCYKVIHKNNDEKNEKKIKNSWINLSIWSCQCLKLSKSLMYEFWYDYVKPIYRGIANYMDTYSFIGYINTDYIYKEIAEDVVTKFKT